MSTRLFTSKEENTLMNMFEVFFAYNHNIGYFDALVGYFRTSCYFLISSFLDKASHMKNLEGINGKDTKCLTKETVNLFYKLYKLIYYKVKVVKPEFDLVKKRICSHKTQFRKHTSKIMRKIINSH